jgi:hypothetical protein
MGDACEPQWPQYREPQDNPQLFQRRTAKVIADTPLKLPNLFGIFIHE